ncbi:MAG TPA: hypothetical protein VKD71_06350 [Gemmataceae bacterium]|nr:hypothetical protein [Gemmataceae bacterium]
MPDRPIRDDVFDPTTDPRHRPPTEDPGEDPDTARPRDPSTENQRAPREEEQSIDNGVFSPSEPSKPAGTDLQVRRSTAKGRSRKPAKTKRRS